MYSVRVRESYRWPTARIGGREFGKREAVTLAEHEMNDEVRRAASEEYGILEIVEVEVEATDGARTLAEARGVDLSEVEGSGQGGRIVKSDVEEHITA